MKSGLCCTILLGAVLLCGCATAELTNDSTSVTVIGEGDVRACRSLETVQANHIETSEVYTYCVEIQGEGISEQTAGVLNTLFSPIRYLGRLIINPMFGS